MTLHSHIRHPFAAAGFIQETMRQEAGEDFLGMGNGDDMKSFHISKSLLTPSSLPPDRCPRQGVSIVGLGIYLLVASLALVTNATPSADFSNYVKPFRRELHGAGYAPQHYPRADYNMDADVKAMGFYSTRTHNWAIYNCAQRVCDLGLVFPCADMDPDDRSAYYFDATDQVIDLATSSSAGSMQVFYTLGNSTDFAGDVAFNGAIPTNYLNTAKTMANVVRHYNQGWNSGKSKGITYWEIWSSPDDCRNYWYREGLTDTQLMNEFATFFATCLKHLKTEFPYYKFGGPGLSSWNTTWLTAILNACAAEGVSPDFISWHCYTDSVTGLTGQPATARAWLDTRGYNDTEIIIDEWHYLPNNSWNGITKYATTKTYVAQAHEQRYFKNCAWGIDSGVFNAAVLSRLQYTDLDRAFFYGNGYTGIGPSSTWAYQDYYTDKNKNYYSMAGFGDIAKAAKRLYGATNEGSVSVMAATDAAGTKGYLVISDYQGTSSSVSVRINGVTGISNISAKRLAYGYNSYNLDSITPTYSSGVLTLNKGVSASAAFFVTFDLTGATVPHQHTWGSWSTTTAATCTTAGTRTRTCTASGCTSPVATQTDTIPPLGHNETADAKASPTCTAAGHTAGVHCSRCNAVIVPTESIPALGHDPVEVEAIAPTVTTAGHTAGIWCSRCHLVSSGIETIPPTGIPSELPTGYLPVEYIEGTGTQYIDTGVTVKDLLSAKVDFEFTSINPSGPYMLAANGLDSSSSRNNRAYFATVNASGVWRGSIGSASMSTFSGIDAARVGTRYFVESSINGASYNISVSNCVSHAKQSASATYSALTTQPKTTMLTLFALNTSTVSYFTSAKLYGCEIWTDTDLTRKYVPCYQKSSGRYGLYDLIGSSFYGSNSETEFAGPPMNISITPTGISNGELSFSVSGLAMDMMFVAAYGAVDGGSTLGDWADAAPIGVLQAGTTSHSFQLPSGWGTDCNKLRIFALLPNAVPATKLEYITADQAGSGASTPQYIDTGCIPTNTTYCSADVRLSNVTVQSRVFESKTTGTNYLVFHAYINGNGYPAFACADSSVSSPWTAIQTSALVSTSKRAEWIVSPKDAKSYYNVNGGSSYNKAISTTRTRNGGGTIRLMWSSGNPSAVGDIYGSVIKKNNVEIRRFVPAKCYADATTLVAGLYDTVNSRFYASAGSAEFVAGPEASDGFAFADFSKAATFGCSAVVQSAVHEHVWADVWTTNAVPTCTTPGERVRSCTSPDCMVPPAAQTNVITALGHDWGEWQTITEPTQDTTGLKRHTCRRAGCNAFEEGEIPATAKTWNILMIGNSFSLQINNSSYPFGVSSRLLGKKVNVYNLYSGGCPLQKHWENHATKNKYGSIQYDLEDNPGVHQYSTAELADTSLDTMLELRDWDVVTLQQASTSSPYLNTYEPYLGNLISLIHQKAPHAEIIFHQTWAYDRESAILSSKPFNGDVANREWMYDQLTSHITSLCSTYGLRTIPVGLAAQLYRYQKPVSTFNDDPCYSDHQHFNSDFKYMQLLVWLQFFWGELPAKADMVTVPNNSSEEALMRSVAVQAVSATDLTQYGQGTVDWSYNVTFNTWDNHLIEVQSVTNGASALPPSPGTRDGMTFQGWKSTFGTDSSAVISSRKVFNPVTYTASWTFDEDPTRVYTTNAMETAAWGYEVHGLGVASNETAYVFTNATAAMEWTVPTSVTSVRYLVVGGGGGGGASSASGTKGGGGGGAGGLLRGTFAAVAGDKLYLKVGAGGSGSSNGNDNGSNGKDSSVTNASLSVSQIAIGGGRGGASGNYYGASGGSSGGAGQTGKAPMAATAGQGNKGGTGITATGGGGGGGAGAPGEDAVENVCAGAGGTGLADDITGKWKYYAAGGGGGSLSSYTRGAGGYGGGGNGGQGKGGSNATGIGCGGGAGTYGGKTGGKGSNGIIVLRCVIGEPVPPGHAHIWSAWTTNTAATCTSSGERTRSCTADGCTVPVATQSEPIAALGHDLGEWYTFKAAEIGVAGEKRRECSRCDYYESETIPALAHTHVWGAWTTNVAATCTTAGERTRSCTAEGCTIPVATETEPVTALGHDLGNWYTFKAAEIGVGGEKRHECSRCDYYESETIPALIDPNGGAAEPFGTNAMANAAWGYEIHGIGSTSNEVALVFTNTTEQMEWTVPAGVDSIRYLVVGGGGSGSAMAAANNIAGGGGGAGGMLFASDYTVTPSTSASISVGAGGAAVSTANTSRYNGKSGSDSVLIIGEAEIRAHGGGYGGTQNGAKGGSGGGAGDLNNGAHTGGAAYDGEGYPGGGAGTGTGGGGGGGAGGAGATATGNTGGKGGNGLQNDITGDNLWYAAGGGGGGKGTSSGGAGGTGGGGKGNTYSGSAATVSGSGTTYGSGGGGTQGNQWKSHTSGAGCQGVVIIRYKVAAAPQVPNKALILCIY